LGFHLFDILTGGIDLAVPSLYASAGISRSSPTLHTRKRFRKSEVKLPIPSHLLASRFYVSFIVAQIRKDFSTRFKFDFDARRAGDH
jgi:hypothetical protein